MSAICKRSFGTNAAWIVGDKTLSLQPQESTSYEEVHSRVLLELPVRVRLVAADALTQKC